MLAKNLWTRWMLLALGVAMVALYLFPLYWMYVTALKTNTEMFRNPPTFWPHDPHWRFAEVWTKYGMDTYIKNSAIIAGGTVALVVLELLHPI